MAEAVQSAGTLNVCQGTNIREQCLAGEMAFKRPSGKKGSIDSTTSSAGTHTHSQRSSFAMERASLEANRSSLEIFANLQPRQSPSMEAGFQNLEAMCTQMGIPKTMCDRCLPEHSIQILWQHHPQAAWSNMHTLPATHLLTHCKASCIHSSCSGMLTLQSSTGIQHHMSVSAAQQHDQKHAYDQKC